MAPRKNPGKTADIDLGQPPKRPLSSYFHFLADARPGVVAANPNLKGKEIVKELGEQWRNLDDKEKEKYNQMNIKDKERYAKEMDAFIKAGGDPKAKAPKKSKAAKDNSDDE